MLGNRLRRPDALVVALTLVAGTLAVIATSSSPAHAVFPGTTGRIAYDHIENGDQVFLMDADGSHQTLLTDGTEPAWSPDSTKLAYELGGEIYVVDVADGTSPKDITPNNATDDVGAHDPAWSPDGTEIAFTRFQPANNGQGDIFMMAADGSGTPTNLTPNTASFDDEEPSWSPDGTLIAFQSDRASPHLPEIFVMGASGSNPTPTQKSELGGPANGALKADWSPDGKRIAYQDATDPPHVWVMGASGSAPTMLTDDATSASQPAWSPDGTMIAFSAGDTSGDDICAMKLSDGSTTNLTKNGIGHGLGNRVPSWGSNTGASSPTTTTAPCTTASSTTTTTGSTTTTTTTTPGSTTTTTTPGSTATTTSPGPPPPPPPTAIATPTTTPAAALSPGTSTRTGTLRPVAHPAGASSAGTSVSPSSSTSQPSSATAGAPPLPPPPTTVTVTGTPNPSAPGQTVTLTATVTDANGAPVDGGTVTFTDSSTGQTLGTAPVHNGVATLTTTFS